MDDRGDGPGWEDGGGRLCCPEGDGFQERDQNSVRKRDRSEVWGPSPIHGEEFGGVGRNKRTNKRINGVSGPSSAPVPDTEKTSTDIIGVVEHVSNRVTSTS